MINLTTFQLRILKFYVLPIRFFGLIVAYNFTYSISKNFTENITFKEKQETIKEIQAKNIKLNGQELKRWTTLTETQKEYFLENEKEKLEDKEKFKIKYKTEYIDTKLTDDNIDEKYNFILFLTVLFLNFKFGILIMFLIPASFLYLFYRKYYLIKLKSLEKFYNLPYFLNDLKSENSTQKNNELNRIKKIDEFLKFDEENQKYLYKTNSITQINIYKKFKKEIEEYLNINNLKIVQKDLIIELSEKTIPKKLNFDENKYQKNDLYLGKSENNKDIVLDINTLRHSIIIGESGSGKSVFVQNILLSIFKNIDKFEDIFLVDFKMVEMMRYTNTNKKIKVVTQINDFVNLTDKLNNMMFERYAFMEKMGLATYSGKATLVFIDEFATIENNNLDKKEKENMINNLINLLQKSRASKIFFIFAGQKADTQNINSSILSNIMTRICLKTTNLDNLTKIAGTLEELEESELSHTEIRGFNKGRMYYKDGESGEKYLIQSPFFDVENEEHNFYMYNLLGLNDKEIKEKLERQKYINKLNEKLKNDEINEREFLKLIDDYDNKDNEIIKKNKVVEIENIEIEKNENIIINDFDDEKLILELYEEIKKIEKEKKQYKEDKMDSCYLIKVHLLNKNKFNEAKERLLKLKEFYQQF
jgi:hypothetical protein